MTHLLWSFHLDGVYYSPRELCSLALLQLDNDSHCSIVSRVIGKMLVLVVVKQQLMVLFFKG